MTEPPPPAAVDRIGRRLPLVATLIVGLAVAVMVGLGVWQLGRAGEKELRLERYEAAAKLPPIAFPTSPLGEELPLYRYATAMCLQPVGRRATAGRNRSGESGYVHIVDCSTGAEGPGLSVEVGWSLDPSAQFDWNGGPVSGVIVPDERMRMRLVAATPPPGLAASALPSPTVPVTPARHRLYAWTWFGLAAAALVIYALALRQRQRKGGRP